MVALFVERRPDVHQLDVTVTDLNKEVFMNVPECFKESLPEIIRAEINLELLGLARRMLQRLQENDSFLKQAERQWQKEIKD